MIYYDLSSLVRWWGPPAGIVRVQARLAAFARARRADVVFTVFDPDALVWRRVSPEWIDRIIDGQAVVDMSLLPDPIRRKVRIQDRLPVPLREGFHWVTRSRRKGLTFLEEMRLCSRSAQTGAILERLIDRLAGEKHLARFRTADGRRIAAPAFRTIAAEPVVPGKGDTVFTVQAEWTHTNIAAIAAMKGERGFRYVAFCHDLIPLRHPEWVEAGEAEAFRAYYEVAIDVADRFLAPSRHVASDLARYAAERGIAVPDIRVTPLGADIGSELGPALAALPDGLEHHRYVLYVSTIEPRKNHGMLGRAWRRLIEDGTVDRHRLRLVLVGRMGYRAKEIRASLDELAGVTVIENASDDVVRTLYASAAICVYPSLDEGFGLPPIEALGFGRPIAASAAGSMPEVLGDRAVLLDPDNDLAWADCIRAWIDRPDEREAFAASARLRYRPLDWDAAAGAIFDAAVLEADAGNRHGGIRWMKD